MARTKHRLEALTSLRFFAALSVAFFHIPYTLPSVSKIHLASWGGGTGVSFFFVLSGFILSHVYPLNEKINKRSFYTKRLARIYPLHLVTLIIWILIFYPNWGIPINDKINSGITNVFLIQAFFLGALFNLGYNAISWSLSVEAFFYFLYPFINKIKYAILIFIGYTGIITCGYILEGKSLFHPNIYYFNPLARLAEFCLGMILYQLANKYNILRDRGTISELFAALFVFICINTYHSIPKGYQFIYLGLSFGIMITILAYSKGILSRILNNPILVLLGEVSFSFYMIHHMWFRILQKTIGDKYSGLPLLLIGLASTIILSILSYCVIEKRARFIITNWLAMKK